MLASCAPRFHRNQRPSARAGPPRSLRCGGGMFPASVADTLARRKVKRLAGNQFGDGIELNLLAVDLLRSPCPARQNVRPGGTVAANWDRCDRKGRPPRWSAELRRPIPRRDARGSRSPTARSKEPRAGPAWRGSLGTVSSATGGLGGGGRLLRSGISAEPRLPSPAVGQRDRR